MLVRKVLRSAESLMAVVSDSFFLSFRYAVRVLSDADERLICDAMTRADAPGSSWMAVDLYGAVDAMIALSLPFAHDGSETDALQSGVLDIIDELMNIAVSNMSTDLFNQGYDVRFCAPRVIKDTRFSPLVCFRIEDSDNLGCGITIFLDDGRKAG